MCSSQAILSVFCRPECNFVFTFCTLPLIQKQHMVERLIKGEPWHKLISMLTSVHTVSCVWITWHLQLYSKLCCSITSITMFLYILPGLFLLFLDFLA